MNFSEFGLLLLSIAAGVGGQFFLKTGALKLGKVTGDNFFSHVMGILTTPELLLGLGFYGAGAILYILLLTRVKISVLGPATSLQYVFFVLLGYFAFREAISGRQLVGLALIACGVILVVRK